MWLQNHGPAPPTPRVQSRLSRRRWAGEVVVHLVLKVDSLPRINFRTLYPERKRDEVAVFLVGLEQHFSRNHLALEVRDKGEIGFGCRVRG